MSENKGLSITREVVAPDQESGIRAGWHWPNLHRKINGFMKQKIKLLFATTSMVVLALNSLSGMEGDPALNSMKTEILGDFRPSPALSLYVIHAAETSQGRLTVRRGPRNEGDRLMIRVFDPEEKLTFRQYVEPGKLADTFGPGSGEIWGIPISIPDTIVNSNDLLIDMDFQLKGQGIHQIRVTAGQINSSVSVALDHSCDFGVSFQNGTYYPWDKSLKTAYVFVPPHAESLEIRGEGVTVENETGKVVFPEPGETNGKKLVTIPITKTGVVWTFRFANPEKWSLGAGGFPVILCNSKAAAETIKASLETLPDGTVVAHKFQRRIAELLPTLLAPDKVGSTEELLKIDLFQNKEAWLAERARNEELLSRYSLYPNLYKALREQNLDPSSHWGGAIGFNIWRENQSKAPPENRWDRLRSPAGGGLWKGFLSTQGDWCKALAEAATLNSPINPFYGRKELLYRAAACALRNLMALPENEEPTYIDMDPYPGYLCFVVAGQYFPEFALASGAMPEEVRAVWQEGLSHIVDRHLPDMMLSCMNQSSHYLVAWQNFALGSGQPRDVELARRYAERFTRNASPAGYFVENLGVDGTYGGIQHHHMALYYRLSKDPVMLEAIRKSYNFYNHTVAPEPDGRAFGGFNYSHRTPQGFEGEQYGGARRLLGDVLPEVALWAKMSDTPEQTAEALKKIEAQFNTPLPEATGMVLSDAFQWWSEKLVPAVWPAAESKSFIREFGDELIAVKRPGYYLAIYTGKPVKGDSVKYDYYIKGRKVFHSPLPERAEDAGGDAWKLYYTPVHPATPLVGGGLTLFWTRAYGSSIFAGNFTPLAHHGLIAKDQDGKRWWEDYFDRSYTLDAKAGELVCIGKIEGLPLRYKRTYRFEPNEVQVALTLTAEKDLQLSDMVENIPLAAGDMKKNGAEILVADEQVVTVPPTEPNADKIHLGKAKAATFKVTDKQGAGLEVQLDAPRELRICRSGMMMRKNQINRVEIVLPTTFKKDEPVQLCYRLIPLNATSK
jgi:hypothetical protein